MESAFLKTWLRRLPLRELIFGALIVGFLIFEPNGLVGLVRRALGHSEAYETRPEH